MSDLAEKLPFNGIIDGSTEVADDTGEYAEFVVDADPGVKMLGFKSKLEIDGNLYHLTDELSERGIDIVFESLETRIEVYYEADELNEFTLNVKIKDEGSGNVETTVMTTPIASDYAEKLFQEHSDGVWAYVE